MIIFFKNTTMKILVSILIIFCFTLLANAEDFKSIIVSNPDRVISIKPIDGNSHSVVVKLLPFLNTIDSVVVNKISIPNKNIYSNLQYCGELRYVLYRIDDNKIMLLFLKTSKYKIINIDKYFDNTNQSNFSITNDPNIIYISGAYGTIEYNISNNKSKILFEYYRIGVYLGNNKFLFTKLKEIKHSNEYYVDKYLIYENDVKWYITEDSAFYFVESMKQYQTTPFWNTFYDLDIRDLNNKAISNLDKGVFISNNKISHYGLHYNMKTNKEEIFFIKKMDNHRIDNKKFNYPLSKNYY